MTSRVCMTVCLAGALIPAAAQALQDFDHRVAEYLKVRKASISEVHGLKPTNSPEKIEHHEHELAEEIRKGRAGAKQGDMFTPEITAEFRKLVDVTMHGPDAVRIRESLRSSSPQPPRPLRVNSSYGHGQPLQSTPPSLLLNLPKLPSGLDYRVVGQALILRDTEANLIVDFIPNLIQ